MQYARRAGRPWLVLRGREWEATQWNGPVLSLGAGSTPRVGAGSARGRDDHRRIVARLRRGDQSQARRRGAGGSARRLGHREHVARRGALAREDVAWSSLADVSDERLDEALDLGAGRDARGGRRFAADTCRLPPSRAVAVRAVARRCGRAGSETPTAPRTGVPSASRPSGEGGIRTLEAGFSPPNALAGRRLQPLGHFSGALRISDGPGATLSPARPVSASGSCGRDRSDRPHRRRRAPRPQGRSGSAAPRSACSTTRRARPGR